MARDIDRLIDWVEGLDYIPPIHRQVIVNRLQDPPTSEELEIAKSQVYPDEVT